MSVDWVAKKLINVCTLQRGFDLPKRLRIVGDTPLVSSSGIIDSHNEWKVQGPGVVTGRSGSIGNVFFVEDDFWPLNTVLYIKNFHGNDPRFIYYLLTNFGLERFSSGAGVPTLNRNHVHDEIVSIPECIEEQRRITAVLDEALGALSTAVDNTARNLQNAQDLFDAYLQATFAKTAETCEEITLDEACIVERGSSPRPIKKYLTDRSDGVNWIKIGDAKNVTRYIAETKQKITPEGAEKSRFVDVGDFILSNSMSYGKPYIMKTQGYIHDGWFVLRLPKSIDTEYFWYLLSSPYVTNQFEYLASGAIVKNISSDLVKRVVLPIPSIEKQREIADILDAFANETQRLETIYQQKLAALNELKQALLHQAFSGNL